jgi:hypothetical protein
MFPDEFKYFSGDERDKYKKSRYTNILDLPIADIDNLYISKDLIFFSFNYHAIEYSLFYDRLQDKIQYGYLTNTDSFPLVQYNFLHIENNCMYSFAYPDVMIDFEAKSYKSRKKTVPSILTSLKPEDNPLLCIHHFSSK